MQHSQNVGADSAALKADHGLESFAAAHQHCDDGVRIDLCDYFEFVERQESILL